MVFTGEMGEKRGFVRGNRGNRGENKVFYRGFSLKKYFKNRKQGFLGGKTLFYRVFIWGFRGF